MGEKVISRRRITAEEAEEFRARVAERNRQLAEWVVIPIDEAIEELEALSS